MFRKITKKKTLFSDDFFSCTSMTKSAKYNNGLWNKAKYIYLKCNARNEMIIYEQYMEVRPEFINWLFKYFIKK